MPLNKTKIEWVKNPDGSQGFASNPITGLCPVECKLPDGRLYCYGRDNYTRFKRDPRITFWMHKLDRILNRKKPAGIFMCSTFEIFHPCTEGFYRDSIFSVIKACPQHRFYILTKFPHNIYHEIPHNVWLGTSITGSPNEDQFYRGFDLFQQKAKLKFISFEPLLYPISESLLEELCNFNWVIIGRLTQHGQKYDPQKVWIENIIDHCDQHCIPVFLKDNLKEIWEGPLIQEMPSEDK